MTHSPEPPSREDAVRCAAVLSRLPEWAELEPAERQALAAHAEGCPTCAPELTAWSGLFARLAVSQSEYRDLQYSGRALDLAAVSQASEDRRPRWRAPLWIWSPVAAALVLAIAAALWVSRGDSSTEQRAATAHPPVSTPEAGSERQPSVHAESPAVAEVPPASSADSAMASRVAEPEIPAAGAARRAPAVDASEPGTGAQAAATRQLASVSPSTALAALGTQARSRAIAGSPSRPSGWSLVIPPRPARPSASPAGGGGGASGGASA